MSSRDVSIVVAAAAVLWACGGSSSSPRDPAPSKPVAAVAPAPPELAFVLSVPSLDHGLDGWQAFADAVSPRAGADLRAWLAEGKARSEGMDLRKPIRVVALASASEDQGWGLLVAPTDTTKLKAAFGAVRQAGAWAFISSPETIDRLAPWALESLALQPTPAAPEVTIYPGPLLATFADEIVTARAEWVDRSDAAASVVAGLFDGFVAGIRQCERVEMRYEASAVRATIEVVVFPRAGTPIAAFVARQKPATFELLPRLTTGDAMVVAAGRGVPEIVGSLYAHLVEQFRAAEPNPLIPDVAVVRAIVAMFAGEIAIAAARPEGQWLPEVRVITSSPSAAGFSAFYDDGARLSMASMDPAPHDGVSFARLGAGEVRFGHWDDVAGFVVGQDSRREIERMVDVSRRRRAADVLPAGFAGAFAEARRRRESFLLVVDLVALATRTPGEDGLAVGLGFSEGAVRLRASVEARHLSAYLGIIGSNAF